MYLDRIWHRDRGFDRNAWGDLATAVREVLELKKVRI